MDKPNEGGGQEEDKREGEQGEERFIMHVALNGTATRSAGHHCLRSGGPVGGIQLVIFPVRCHMGSAEQVRIRNSPVEMVQPFGFLDGPLFLTTKPSCCM